MTTADADLLAPETSASDDDRCVHGLSWISGGYSS
jgi:hypothetical protein